uniref:Uncharacterized protein n=1 Tax=Anguilla anguilla TaxID=7936 RepID=A0A0E9Q9N3_ANGAN
MRILTDNSTLHTTVLHLILFLHRYIGIAVRLYICNTIGGKNEPYTI